jgi:hypothetical protein
VTDEDDSFRKHVLGIVQLFTFAVAIMLLAAIYYSSQQETVCEKDNVRIEGRGGDSERAPEDATGGDAADADGRSLDPDVRGLRPH